jgi:hypothetical protein
MPSPTVCSCSPSKIKLRLKIHFNPLTKNPAIPNPRQSLHLSFLHRAHGTIHVSSSVYEDDTLLELGLNLVATLATLIVEDLPHGWSVPAGESAIRCLKIVDGLLQN